MTEKKIKSYLEDRLKSLESIRGEREFTTAELGDIACCKQTLAFINSQEEPVGGLDNGDMPVERWKQAVEAASNQRSYRSSKGLTETRDDYFVDGVQWADEHPKEVPVSEDLEEVAEAWCHNDDNTGSCDYIGVTVCEYAFKAGAQWQKEHLWKPADGDDLPEIDREVIALTQPYPNDEHLKVVFAHRPNNKYAKVWNSDLGEEQVIELEWFGKGEWNIPFVKYWLDAKLPYEENKISKEIEL